MTKIPKQSTPELEPSDARSNEMPRSDRFVSREGDFQIIRDPKKQEEAVETYKRTAARERVSKKPTKDELYEAAVREVRADYGSYLREWAKQVREFVTKQANIRAGESRDNTTERFEDGSRD